jgi:hypothetical protein
VRGEVASRRLAPLRLRGLRIQRHFHVIHSEARTLSAGARALVAMLSERAAKRGRGAGTTGPAARRATGERGCRARARPYAPGGPGGSEASGDRAERRGNSP